MDGVYSISYRGAVDWGIGMLVLWRGGIDGADAGGIVYEGTYTVAGDFITFDCTMKVPAGVPLVQGVPARPTPYTVPFNVTVKKAALLTGEPTLVKMPPGPVNVIFRRLRVLEG